MFNGCLRRLPALFALAAAAPLAAQTPAPTLPPLNFSGLLFGSYNVQESVSGAPLNRQIDNSFIIDRAYLTFRMPAGERASIRVTTDIYQTTEATANAYTVRAKYAYLQYDVPKADNGTQVQLKVGILQNVIIEHVDAFWQRVFSMIGVERAGYFASADAGVAGTLTLPNKIGEVYATIVNGPGYTSRETDRFKDFAVRLSFTPLANEKELPLLNTLTFTGWVYKGATASSFVNGGAGTNGAIGEALDRSRAGLFVGLKDPRLLVGAELAERTDGAELGLNTVASPRTVTESTGHLLALYTIVHPFAFNGNPKSPFGIVGRYDRVTPTSSTTGFVTVPSTDNSYHNIIAGVTYDLNARVLLALDYQESLASSNGVSASPPSPLKGYFAHFKVDF